MRGMALTGLLALAVVAGAGCGGGQRGQRHAAESHRVLVRFCGPWGANGRALKRCSFHRIAVHVYAGTPPLETLSSWRSRDTPAGDGRLTGFVAVCGDQSLRPVTAPPRNECTLQLGRVQVEDASGHVIAREKLDSDGRFALKLPRGHYRLITWNAGNGPWKEKVEVKAGRQTTADVVIVAI